MISDMKPFRIAGNLYFVGTYMASSHLLTTEEGHILIDTGYSFTARSVLESVESLGFDVKDIKYILHSHGHADHTGATAMIAQLTGAKTFLAKEDEKYISGFVPDFYFHDGDVVKLGNTEIKCVFTPGHTEGSYSFFFDVEEDGKTYRAAMFGGAGTNQLKKKYLLNKVDYGVLYNMRGDFFKSIEKIKNEKVDIFVGNHTWHNDLKGKYEKSLKGEKPFINSDEWKPFLEKLSSQLKDILKSESKSEFICFAHRGASEYFPENTAVSFDAGIIMGANGIETDIRRSRDGVLYLFHDDNGKRVCDSEVNVSDLTYDELLSLSVKKNDYSEKIMKFKDFLDSYLPIAKVKSFALEIKEEGIEEDIVNMLSDYKQYMSKITFTSFNINSVVKIRELEPKYHTGWLKSDFTDDDVDFCLKHRIDELCPEAKNLTEKKVDEWHMKGFNVRAWGAKDEELMKKAYDAGCDGMTVNFPDKLLKYIKECGN